MRHLWNYESLNWALRGCREQTVSMILHLIAIFVGHTIGLHHDFAWADGNGGPNGPCNGKGLMSKVTNRPIGWSKCSQKNLLTYYNIVLSMGREWCMPGTFQK